MNEELRALLAKYIAQRNETLPEAAAPQGPEQEGWNLPRMSLESRGPGTPAMGGEYGQGGVTLRGEFHRPNPQDKPRWGAMLGYRKEF